MWSYYQAREVTNRAKSSIQSQIKKNYIPNIMQCRLLFEKGYPRLSPCTQHTFRLSSNASTKNIEETRQSIQPTSEILKSITNIRSTPPIPIPIEETGETILSKLYTQNQKDPLYINTNLHKMLQHDDIWISSFLKLQPRLDNINLEHVMSMKKDILSNEFTWIKNKINYYKLTKKQYYNAFPLASKVRSIRRRKHQKAKSKKGEQSTIPEMDYNNQKVIQEMIRKILSCIYEPTFFRYNHGYRPGSATSSHTALQDVRDNFNNCKYILKGSLSSYVGDETLYYKNLQSILQKKINDESFLNLINEGCRANVLFLPSFTGTNTEVTFHNPDNNILQLNHLLWNIYLHEFDKFIHGVIMSNFYNIVNESNVQIKFVRYGDHFLIGFKSNDKEDEYRDDNKACYKKAIEVQEEMKAFLNTTLNLNVESYLVDVTPGFYYHNKKRISFLGYILSLHKGILQKGGIRKGRGRIVLKVDGYYLLHKLNIRGYCTRDGDPRPVFKFLHDPQNLTNDKINRMFAGIIEYYKLAENIRHFGNRLFYILCHSVAKMYAAKYRWHRRSRIFRLGGRDLGMVIKKKRKPQFVPKEKQVGSRETKMQTDVVPRKERYYDVPPLKGIIYNRYNQIPYPIRSLGYDPSEYSSFKTIYKGVEDYRLYYFEFQHVGIVDELLGKFTTGGYKPRKIYGPMLKDAGLER